MHRHLQGRPNSSSACFKAMGDHATEQTTLTHVQLGSHSECETEASPNTIRRKTFRHQRHQTAAVALQEPMMEASLICGLLAGMAQAGIFNPYDRALYLSVKESRPFLSLQNWQSPYAGFLQSISVRALAGGLYFPLEHFFLDCLDDNTSKNNAASSNDSSVDSRTNLIAGTAAGAVNACVINPLSAVKYKTWGRNVQRGMWREVTSMLTKSGFSVRPFFNGLAPTVYRDVVFGGCYTWMRLQIQLNDDRSRLFLSSDWKREERIRQFGANLVAAACATVASGPFNYVRNVQYATSSRERAPTTMAVLRDLGHETYWERKTAWERMELLQNRLRLGWGTARVAIGMAFGHAVYDGLHEIIRNSHK